MNAPQIELRKYRSEARRVSSLRFFKTKPGEYGAGDHFLGVSVPDTRKVVAKFAGSNQSTIKSLLGSKFHEDRLLAILILVHQFERSDPSNQKALINLAMGHLRFINNWDLVDSCASQLFGKYTFDHGKTKILTDLLRSESQWHRRIAIVATFYWIRQNNLNLTFKFSKILLKDPEDLMHKATGWMLREAGKRDPDRLRKFIAEMGARMPRTMLRYAIEKFSKAERKLILHTTRVKP
ncbi:MAG: DNA alkylation repair protein [Proteobacteria bacterium]|nr:DNA alkylation repair protein [Pseudomonadota bacterium]